VSYVSGLLAAAAAAASSAVVSACDCEALKRAACATGNKMVELVKQVRGSGAAAAAKTRLDMVAAALRGGACGASFAATVVATLDAACLAAVQAGARRAFATMLPELASAAKTTSLAAAAASLVEDIKFIVKVCWRSALAQQ